MIARVMYSSILQQHSNTSPKLLYSFLLARSMGGGPRTFPSCINKWQWKHPHEKKAKEKEKRDISPSRNSSTKLESDLKSGPNSPGNPIPGSLRILIIRLTTPCSPKTTSKPSERSNGKIDKENAYVSCMFFVHHILFKYRKKKAKKRTIILFLLRYYYVNIICLDSMILAF